MLEGNSFCIPHAMGLVAQNALEPHVPEKDSPILLVAQHRGGGQDQGGPLLEHAIVQKAFCKLPAFFGLRGVVPKDSKVRTPSGAFSLPVFQDSHRHHGQKQGTAGRSFANLHQEVQEDQGLRRLAQTHLISQNATIAQFCQGQEPSHAHTLIALHLGIAHGGGSFEIFLRRIILPVMPPCTDAAAPDRVLHLRSLLPLRTGKAFHHGLLHLIRQGFQLLPWSLGHRLRLRSFAPRAAAAAAITRTWQLLGIL
mmetsp:Transcript_63560/g.139283  ORF Transcript_63560/g.139283 Transcript_63560/m.139283 type:complete len:253 (-) Transcript_63560:376-1134(-)